MSRQQEEPHYSEKYCDDKYEYRHVILPPRLAVRYKGERLLTETEWRNLGVVQSHGWEHYMIHAPEPHILLFKRELNYIEKYGNRPRPTSENDVNAMQH